MSTLRQGGEDENVDTAPMVLANRADRPVPHRTHRNRRSRGGWVLVALVAVVHLGAIASAVLRPPPRPAD